MCTTNCPDLPHVRNNMPAASVRASKSQEKSLVAQFSINIQGREFQEIQFRAVKGHITKPTLNLQFHFLKPVGSSVNVCVILPIYFVCLKCIFYNFIYLLAVLCLCCCQWAFSSCGKWGQLLPCGAGFSWRWCSCRRAGALGVWGFSNCGAQA